MKVKVCTCEQCRFAKHLRKNRKLKKVIKRLMNKRRRRGCEDKITNWYWA